jgi:hypothetical protein
MTELYLYIYLLISLGFFYVIGHSVLFVFNIKQASNAHINLFSKLAIGVILFVFLYSVIVTKGKTIYLEFIIIGTGMLYLLKKENLFLNKKQDIKLFFQIDKKQGLRLLLETIIVAAGWFLWQQLFCRNIPYAVPGQDVAYYSKVAEYLNMTGNENAFTTYNLFDSKYNATSPYHYFEIWLTAGLSRAFSTLSIIAYIKLMVPVFLTIISIGIIAIFKIFFKSNYFNLLLPLLLFSQAIYISQFLTNIETFVLNPFNNPKLLPIYLFITAFFVFYNANRILSFIILLIIPLTFVSTAAGIYSSLTLFALYNLLFKKSLITKAGSFLILVLTGVLFTFFLSFYFLTAVKGTDVYSAINLNSAFENLPTSVNIFGATSLQITYLYLIYFIIFFSFSIIQKIKYVQVSNIIGLLFLIYFTSLITWAVLLQMADSVQVFDNISIPFINMTLVYFSIILLKELHKKITRLLIFILLISSISIFSAIQNYYSQTYFENKMSYSPVYFNSIKELITNDTLNPLGVSLRGKQDYISWPDKVPIISALGNYLKLMKPNFNTISLSVHDTPLDSSTIINYNRELLQVKSSIFYNFVENQKEKGLFTSISKSQIDFIKVYKIQYGVISKNVVLSTDMNSIIDQTIEDSKTGERFVIFKY